VGEVGLADEWPAGRPLGGSGANGWVQVLALVSLILADAIVWFAIAQGWPWRGVTSAKRQQRLAVISLGPARPRPNRA
jgi:hypothetical protein